MGLIAQLILVNALLLIPLAHTIKIPRKVAPDGLVEDLISRSTRHVTNASPNSHMSSMSLPLVFRQRPGQGASPEPEDDKQKKGRGRGRGKDDEDDSSPEPHPWHFTGNQGGHDQDSDDGDQEKYSNPYCKNRHSPIGAAVLSADYYGSEEDFMYVDKRHAFFRFALGFSKQDVNRSCDEAIQYFREMYGLDLKDGKFDEDSGALVFPNDIELLPVVFTFNFYVSAHNMKAMGCADEKAVLGGWMLFASDIEVTGPLTKVKSEEVLKYPGPSFMFQLYFAVNPGMPNSLRISYTSTYPMSMEQDGTTVVSGYAYGLDGQFGGFIDGVSMIYKFSGFKYTHLFRLVLTIPGRINPFPNDDA